MLGSVHGFFFSFYISISLVYSARLLVFQVLFDCIYTSEQLSVFCLVFCVFSLGLSGMKGSSNLQYRKS